MPLSKTGDIDQNIRLLGETGTDPNKRQVVQRVSRFLDEWAIASTATPIEPEKRFVVTSGGTYTLSDIQGLYEVANQATEKITISANKFTGDITSIDLQPGQILQSKCTLSGTTRTYTRLVTSSGTSSAPPVTGGASYESPTSNNNLEPGFYYLSTGGVYSIEAVNQNAAQLPKEWFFWKTTDGKASIFFQPGTATPIYFVKSGNWALTANDLEIVINKGQVISIQLRVASSGDLVAIASVGISHNKTVFYTVDLVYEAPKDSTSTPVKHNLSATRQPSPINDNSDGYSVGSMWGNAGFFWVASSVAAGNAVWTLIAKPFGSVIPVLNEIPTDTTVDCFIMRSPLNSSHLEGLWVKTSDNIWLVQ